MDESAALIAQQGWAVGAGLLFLLLLVLATVGFGTLLLFLPSVTSVAKAVKYLVLACGFAQAWLVYALCRDFDSPATVEYAWLISMAAVVSSYLAWFFWRVPTDR